MIEKINKQGQKKDYSNKRVIYLDCQTAQALTIQKTIPFVNNIKNVNKNLTILNFVFRLDKIIKMRRQRGGEGYLLT